MCEDLESSASATSAGRPRVLIVTAELSPIVKTGGLGDMVRAIADSLASRGFDVSVLLPGYRQVLLAINNEIVCQDKVETLGHSVDLQEHSYEGLRMIVVRADPLFDRPGNPYRSDQGAEWPDLAERFAVLANVAAKIANGSTSMDVPDVLHLHDWHTALTPGWLAEGCNAVVVLTIHNFMFQGRVSIERARRMQFTDEMIRIGEFFGGVSFLQVGLHLADNLVTVGRSYAAELKLRSRFNWWYVSDRKDTARIEAVPNWPDLVAWSPSRDPVLPMRFDEESLDRRSVNRRALEEHLGWEQDGRAILCTVSRVTKPKGFGFLLRRMARLLERDCRIVIVGDGDQRLLNGFRNIATSYPDRVSVVSPYAEDYARLVLAGADVLLMPSLTEPSGLSQQQAQVYGCVPIVSRAGGLPDTVEDGVTGFLFDVSDPSSFLTTVDRALDVRLNGEWTTIQRAGMQRGVGQDRSGVYASLFSRLLHRPLVPTCSLADDFDVDAVHTRRPGKLRSS